MTVPAEALGFSDDDYRLTAAETETLTARLAAIKQAIGSLPSSLTNGDTGLPTEWHTLIEPKEVSDSVTSAINNGNRKALLVQYVDAMLQVPDEAAYANAFFRNLGAHVILGRSRYSVEVSTLPQIAASPKITRFMPEEWTRTMEHFDESALVMSGEFDWPNQLVAKTDIDGVQIVADGSSINHPKNDHLEFKPNLLVRVRE